jgi:hypothetical protein
VRPSITTVIPAGPGWFALSRWDDEKTGERGYHRDPVVAFRIESFTDRLGGSIVSAIDVTGDENGHIQAPSGRVWCPCDGWFANADAWLAGQQGSAPAAEEGR